MKENPKRKTEAQRRKHQSGSFYLCSDARGGISKCSSLAIAQVRTSSSLRCQSEKVLTKTICINNELDAIVLLIIMKRYRVFQFDSDNRTHFLTVEIKEEWDEKAKKQHYQNREQIEEGLIIQYGASDAYIKKQNFIDLGPKPISILAFHNKFFGK